MKILVDADACPLAVKQILFKTAKRLDVDLVLVANQFLRVPNSPLIKCLIVSAGSDVADDKIVEIMEKGDLVISADIPLAYRVIKKQGFVLDPRGKFLTDTNIGQRLASRNLSEDLRSAGIETGGANSYSSKDKLKFANQLDKFLTQVLSEY